MNTPYFALYPTDFLADVGHLGNTELGIYWRLLLVYYRDGRPLPLDTDRLRRIAMAFSPEECRALDSVVAEFFTLSTEPDGTRVWRHKRADIELARAAHAHERKSAAARATNEKRWGRGSLEDPIAKRSLSDVAKRPVSDGEPEPEPEPDKGENKMGVQGVKNVRQTPQPAPPAAPNGAKMSPAQELPPRGDSPIGMLIAAGVDRQLGEDYLRVRRVKKAPLTRTSMFGLQREAAKAGMAIEDAVRVCVERGWIGFKADWVLRDAPLAGLPAAAAGLSKTTQRNLRSAMDFVASIKEVATDER